MKKIIIGLKYKKRKFQIKAKKLSEFEKFIGLMFSSRENARALLFEFAPKGSPLEKNSEKIDFHSFFVFFPFLAVWLDNKNNVLDVQIIRPFRINFSSGKPYSKLLEIPINNNYRKVVRILVGNSASSRRN